jgi:hypothetical protein
MKVNPRGKLLDDIKASFVEYTTSQLLAWVKHVRENPYRGGKSNVYSNISDDIIKLLDEEITHRGVEYNPIVPPYLRGQIVKVINNDGIEEWL